MESLAIGCGSYLIHWAIKGYGAGTHPSLAYSWNSSLNRKQRTEKNVKNSKLRECVVNINKKEEENLMGAHRGTYSEMESSL